MSETQQKLRRRLIERLEKLSPGTTLCPGKLARDCGRVLAEIRADLMALASAGKITLSQRGKVVRPEGLKGPFRVSIAKPLESNLAEE